MNRQHRATGVKVRHFTAGVTVLILLQLLIGFAERMMRNWRTMFAFLDTAIFGPLARFALQALAVG
ncbi:MAG: hypothetical protein ABI238_07310 [Terrimesophilobacter sp.]